MSDVEDADAADDEEGGDFAERRDDLEARREAVESEEVDEDEEVWEGKEVDKEAGEERRRQRARRPTSWVRMGGGDSPQTGPSA